MSLLKLIVRYNQKTQRSHLHNNLITWPAASALPKFWSCQTRTSFRYKCYFTDPTNTHLVIKSIVLISLQCSSVLSSRVQELIKTGFSLLLTIVCSRGGGGIYLTINYLRKGWRGAEAFPRFHQFKPWNLEIEWKIWSNFFKPKQWPCCLSRGVLITN